MRRFWRSVSRQVLCSRPLGAAAGLGAPSVRLVLAALGVLAALALPAGSRAGEVPDPAEVSHPGAQAVPASSPETYDAAEAFDRRARRLRQALRHVNLQRWRRGQFQRGGEAGKHLPLHAMARLLHNAKDGHARRFMNDDRSYTEHYHYAAANWARFLPLCGEALSDETRVRLGEYAARYTGYAGGRGDEHQRLLWATSLAVLPHYVSGERVARMDKERALAAAKAKLRRYVRTLYHVGQGEWDCPDAHGWSIIGMLNLYDFSRDEQMRLLAKAALDYYVAAYALKYTDGVYAPPHLFGRADGPAATTTDQLGWLWWGGAKVDDRRLREFRFALHAATSGYRPNRVLCRIARKELPDLPAVQRNTKPAYWVGRRIDPRARVYVEHVLLGPSYTLGALAGGGGQTTTRFGLVVRGPDGPILLTGGHPTGFRRGAGAGRYDQSAVVGATCVCLSRIPDDAEPAYSHFLLPEAADEPQQVGPWVALRVGEVLLAVRAVGEAAEIGPIDLPPEQAKVNAERAKMGQGPRYRSPTVVKFPGRRTGFVLAVAEAKDHENPRAFAVHLNSRTRLRAEGFAAPEAAPGAPAGAADGASTHDAAGSPAGTADAAGPMRVRYVDPTGREIEVTYQPGALAPAVRTRKIGGPWSDLPTPTAVYDGPFVRCAGGVLRVQDGQDGFVVDFTGDWPAYKPLR